MPERRIYPIAFRTAIIRSDSSGPLPSPTTPSRSRQGSAVRPTRRRASLTY